MLYHYNSINWIQRFYYKDNKLSSLKQDFNVIVSTPTTLTNDSIPMTTQNHNHIHSFGIANYRKPLLPLILFQEKTCSLLWTVPLLNTTTMLESNWIYVDIYIYIEICLAIVNLWNKNIHNYVLLCLCLIIIRH